MPRPSDWDYFMLICTEAELQQQFAVCRNSDFRVDDEHRSGGMVVYDRKTALLRAEPGPLGWLVWLHRKYYHHPFGPPTDGSALPGVP